MGKAEKSRKKAPYRPRQRNALYSLATAYKCKHPKATAKEAWQHFCTVAAIGAYDVILRHDAEHDTLAYFPDADRRSTKTVTKRGFEQQFYRL